jgi:hypothetical protein
MKWYYTVIVIILVILVGICIYYVWKKNNDKKMIEPFQIISKPIVRAYETYAMIRYIQKLYSISISFGNTHYFVTTLTYLDNNWIQKIHNNNIKYIFDYNIARTTSENSYYLLTVENKKWDTSQYNNISNLADAGFIGIKPITIVENVNNIEFRYYFMGCTAWYTDADNAETVDDKAYETQSTPAKPATFETNIYCNIDSQTKKVIPLAFNDYYLNSDINSGNYEKLADDDGSGGSLDHSIYYNKTTGNFIPMVGYDNNSSKYFAGPLKNWTFGSKLDNFLGLVLYPDLTITWNTEPCYYFLKASWIKDNNIRNKYVNINPSTDSITLDTNPYTIYLKIIGTYIISGQTKNCVKYIAFLNGGNKILGVKSCNAENNTDFNKLTTFTIDTNNNPNDFSETELNLMNYSSPPYWHNYKKPWYALDTTSINFIGTSYDSQECGLYTDETVVYGMRSQKTNFYKVTLSSIDIKIPTTEDLSIKKLYSYQNNYYHIIPHQENGLTYYKIMSYPDLTIFPTTTPDASENIFFNGNFSNDRYTFEKNYYEFNNTCINIKIFDTTDPNIQFIQYIRIDPFDNYIEDASYTIDKFPNNIFNKYTKNRDNENLSVFIDTVNNLILSYNIDTDTFELIKNIISTNTTSTVTSTTILSTTISTIISEFEAPSIKYKSDKFIYYKNQVRFKNIDENNYGVYEFPIQTIQLTTKTFSITKYIPTTTTQPTTTAYESTTTTSTQPKTTTYETTTTAYEPKTTTYETTATTPYETTTTAYETTTTAYETTTTAYEPTTTAYEPTTTAYGPTRTTGYYSDSQPPTKPTGNLIYFS